MFSNRIEKLSNSIDTLNPLRKKEIILQQLFYRSVILNFDTEGRVTLPEKLMSHANIKKDILFVGLGKTFQIWNPNLFEKFKILARKKLSKQICFKMENNNK